MKKTAFILVIVALLAFSACQGQKRCPAYDNVDKIEFIDLNLITPAIKSLTK